jgi:hypothetical protein
MGERRQASDLETSPELLFHAARDTRDGGPAFHRSGNLFTVTTHQDAIG